LYSVFDRSVKTETFLTID